MQIQALRHLFRSISALIGIPDAVGLQLKSWDLPCRKEDIFFDLSSCSSTWSENVDFSFTLMKASCELITRTNRRARHFPGTFRVIPTKPLLFQALLLYTLPLIFMSVAYYHIVKTLWRSNTFPGETSPGAPSGTGTGTSGAENGNLLNSSSTAPLMRCVTIKYRWWRVIMHVCYEYTFFLGALPFAAPPAATFLSAEARSA